MMMLVASPLSTSLSMNFLWILILHQVLITRLEKKIMMAHILHHLYLKVLASPGQAVIQRMIRFGHAGLYGYFRGFCFL